MFITWNGAQPINQYLSPPASHLVLSHPALPDSLLLAEHDEQPYENYLTGSTQADGRSLLGAIRLRGNNWRKDQWDCNFLVLAAQKDLFELLLSAQESGFSSVSLIDRWIDGVVITKLVWLQIDRQYLSFAAANSWYRLQFQLWEI